MEKKNDQFENETPDISVLATTVVLNTNVSEVENRIES